ncbi:hypothetical protein [Lentzea sp. NPDC060358]|uniref:hypothetical protein n=1 Tax=Lentzea sp. NPDC060358 TaxID=3347103 RepID=UPI00364771B7
MAIVSRLARMAAVCPLVVLPRSMEQVRRHPEDVAGYEDPLFPLGHGLPRE